MIALFVKAGAHYSRPALCTACILLLPCLPLLLLLPAPLPAHYAGCTAHALLTTYPALLVTLLAHSTLLPISI